MQERRQRIHELQLADGDELAMGSGGQGDAAGGLERTASTLDALVEQELGAGLGQAVHSAWPQGRQGDGSAGGRGLAAAGAKPGADA
jgi:hypothetical protein